MTDIKQHPGRGDRGAVGDLDGSEVEASAPDRLGDPDALLVAHDAVARLHRAARRLHRGPMPPLGSPAWLNGGWVVQVATLAVCGEAWLAREDDIDQAVTERLKAASLAVAEGGRWTGHGPSHTDLERRRGELGPMARPFDPVAARRWVETGSGAEGAA